MTHKLEWGNEAGTIRSDTDVEILQKHGVSYVNFGPYTTWNDISQLKYHVMRLRRWYGLQIPLSISIAPSSVELAREMVSSALECKPWRIELDLKPYIRAHELVTSKTCARSALLDVLLGAARSKGFFTAFAVKFPLLPTHLLEAVLYRAHYHGCSDLVVEQPTARCVLMKPNKIAEEHEQEELHRETLEMVRYIAMNYPNRFSISVAARITRPETAQLHLKAGAHGFQIGQVCELADASERLAKFEKLEG